MIAGRVGGVAAARSVRRWYAGAMSKKWRAANIVLVGFLLVALGVLFAVVMALVRETGPKEAAYTVSTTSLHEAARKGDAAGVQAALSSGADVNALVKGVEGRTGMPPLICAAYEGNAETVKALLAAKAKVDARAEDGRTALMYAAGWGDEARVRAILEAPALAGGKGEIARLVNMVVPEGGWTALMFAAACGEAGSMKALLDAGAEVDARNKWRQTALMAAARSGDLSKVKMLLNAKASVRATDSDSNTALGVAASGDADSAVLRALLEAGAEVDAADFEGVTALMRAAHRADLSQIKVLLEFKALTSKKDSNGWTAVDWAKSRDDDLGKQAAALLGGT